MRFSTKLFTALTLLGLSGMANATIVTFTLDTEVSGSGDSLTGPIIVTLDDENTAGNVNITIDMTALTAAEFMSGLYLNFDPAKDPAGMTIADTGVQASAGISAGIDCCKPDGRNRMDVQIDFPTSGGSRFTGGETYTGTLSLDGLLATDFAYFNAEPDLDCGMARVQGLGPDAEGSGWFTCEGGGPPNEIVEPGSLALFGLGVGLLGFFGRRRRNG